MHCLILWSGAATDTESPILLIFLRTNERTGQSLVGPNALWPTQPKFWVGHRAHPAASPCAQRSEPPSISPSHIPPPFPLQGSLITPFPPCFSFLTLLRGYRRGLHTVVQAWRTCPLLEPAPSHPHLLGVDLATRGLYFCSHVCVRGR